MNKSNINKVEVDPSENRIDPKSVKIENIHQKVRDSILAEGCSLEMSEWHKCGTTHCRGGWVTHIAGEQGKELESRFGMPLAAHIIYDNSSDIKVPWHNYFQFDNGKAMEDISRCAEQELKLTK